MSNQLDDLTAITGAAYQSDLARLQAINAEEAALRQELDALTRQEQDNAATDPSNLLALRQIGGDLLWNAWIGRKREALNMQLAMVMARKLSAAQLLKRSFGRNAVSEDLRDQAQFKRKAEQALQSLAEEQASMVLRAGARLSRVKC